MENANVSLLVMILIVVLPILAGAAIVLVRAQSKNLQTKTDLDILDKAIQWAEDTLVTSINALNQTTVDGLKAAHADGKLTDEEIEMLKNTAINTTLDILGPSVVSLLGTIMGDSNLWLKTKLEDWVKQLKQE